MLEMSRSKYKEPERITLAALSHELRVPLPRLQGLWRNGVVWPSAASAEGLKFDRAKLEMFLRFSGDIE